MPYLIRKNFKILGQFSNGIIFASRKSKKYYKNFLSKNIKFSIIHAPVNTNRFCSNKIPKNKKIKLPSLKNKIVIGTVANINPIKNISLIIKTTEILNKQFKNLIFLIVGPIYKSQKKYFKKIKDLCENLEVKNVFFTGSYRDIRPLLSRFDIYMCSSLNESSPTSVWEALSMAKPVISTNVGDVPIFVKNKHNGYIVNSFNEKIFARKLCELINDKKLRVSFGKKSRKIAEQHLNLSNCAKKHFDFYNSILN